MIVELRQYTLHPGARDTLIELFERELVHTQEACGIRVLGRFHDRDDPDRFVWLRAFPDMPSRKAALACFYGGPVWKQHRDAANATMIDSDDVLLLRELDGAAFPEEIGTIAVYSFDRPIDDEAIARVPHALLRTESAENDFPALPVRAGEQVIVALLGDDASPLEVPGARLTPIRVARVRSA